MFYEIYLCLMIYYILKAIHLITSHVWRSNFLFYIETFYKFKMKLNIVFYLFPDTPLIPDTLIFQILSILANTKITYLDRSSCEDIN